MKTTAQGTIESAISECTAHKRWIRRNRALLKETFPLSPRHVEHLEERTVELLDQLLYRFTKLQDSMARRLLPALYQYVEETSEPTAFIDILNRLEALGFIESVERWQEFRTLRNNLTHDYPESRVQTTTTLNQLHAELPAFLGIFDRLVAEYARRTASSEQPGAPTPARPAEQP